MLTLTGSNSASALASTPARYIIGDERDRWATSAGTEGDPWALAEARQATFYNAKAVEVSTPTIKGNSNIETSFYQGTQERWCHRCPECGEYSEIVFDNIHFDPEVKRIRGKKSWSLKSGVSWSCPACGCLIPEDTMRKQPAKWIADNPDAYKKGVRSFWLNAFSSPWTPWEKIVLKFLDAKDDPQRLKCVLTAPGAGRTAYGAVSQVEQSDGEFHTYAGRRVPKYVSSAEGNSRTLTISSRPLMIPNNKNPLLRCCLLRLRRFFRESFEFTKLSPRVIYIERAYAKVAPSALYDPLAIENSNMIYLVHIKLAVAVFITPLKA